MLQAVSPDKTANKCILLITTYGGSAESAFKITRWLQRIYSTLVVFPMSICASAGTLIAIGASELIMSPVSQLGPLDVQLLKPNELGAHKSGMVWKSTLSTLERSAFEFWQNFTLEITKRSLGNIDFETCAHIGASICSSLFAEFYKQIDPEVLGENERDLLVAFEYGWRLANWSQNISEEAIESLVKGYVSHQFVIDFEEAGNFVCGGSAIVDSEKVWRPSQDGPSGCQGVGEAVTVRIFDTDLGARRSAGGTSRHGALADGFKTQHPKTAPADQSFSAAPRTSVQGDEVE